VFSSFSWKLGHYFALACLTAFLKVILDHVYECSFLYIQEHYYRGIKIDSFPKSSNERNFKNHLILNLNAFLGGKE
jgi:hypothetical protein